jgi:hypothetical protein
MPSITSSTTKVPTKNMMFQHHCQPNIALSCASFSFGHNYSFCKLRWHLAKRIMQQDWADQKNIGNSRSILELLFS